MTDRSRNLLVGGFVLIGLLCGAVLIVLFGGTHAFYGKRYTVTARFDKVLGIREGTEVNLAGVWAGSVLSVRLADPTNPSQGVDVVLDIDPQYSIPEGSVAVVTIPLMGQSSINILPPVVPAPLLPQDGTARIRGEMRNPLEQVVDPKMMNTFETTAARIGELAKALTPAAEALTKLLEQRTIEEVDRARTRQAPAPEAVVANISTVVQRMDEVLRYISEVIGDPAVQSNLKLTLENFRAASEQAREAAAGLRGFSEEASRAMAGARNVVGKVEATVDSAHRTVDALGPRLIAGADQLSRILDDVSRITRQAAEGEGTVAMLLRDPKFYEELLLTVQRLGDAAAELQVLIKQWQKQGLLGAVRGG